MACVNSGSYKKQSCGRAAFSFSYGKGFQLLDRKGMKNGDYFKKGGNKYEHDLQHEG